MNKLKEFYQSFSFIITFMFLSVLISALFGQKFLNKFLLLVLTSQLLLNSDKAINLINKFKLSSEKVNNNTNNNNKNNTSNKFSGDVKNGFLTATGLQNKVDDSGLLNKEEEKDFIEMWKLDKNLDKYIRGF